MDPLWSTGTRALKTLLGLVTGAMDIFSYTSARIHATFRLKVKKNLSINCLKGLVGRCWRTDKLSTPCHCARRSLQSNRCSAMQLVLLADSSCLCGLIYTRLGFLLFLPFPFLSFVNSYCISPCTSQICQEYVLYVDETLAKEQTIFYFANKTFEIPPF